MSSEILISLHPQHSTNILSGRKTVELRRRLVRVPAGTRVWLYATHPRSRIEGWAIVERVCEAPLDELWAQFKDEMAITRGDFDKYLDGVVIGCAIVLKSAAPLERSVGLSEMRRNVRSFHPPQFFKKLSPHGQELQVLAPGNQFG